MLMRHREDEASDLEDEVSTAEEEVENTADSLVERNAQGVGVG